MSWWDYGYQIAGMANRTTLGEKHHEMSINLPLIQGFISRLFIKDPYSLALQCTGNVV